MAVVAMMLVAVAVGTVTFVVSLWFQGLWFQGTLLALFGAQIAASITMLLVGELLAFRSRDSASEPSSDQRSAARARTFKRGKLEWDGGQADCIIQDLSQEGARLTFSNTVHPPDLLFFYIAEQKRTARAHVRWRTANEMGIEFLRNGDASHKDTAQGGARRIGV